MGLHLGEVACGVVGVALCAAGFASVRQYFHQTAVGVIDIVPQGLAFFGGQQLVGGIAGMDYGRSKLGVSQSYRLGNVIQPLIAPSIGIGKR